MIARFHLPLRHHAFTGYAQVIVYATLDQLRAAYRRFTNEPDSIPLHDMGAVWHGQVCNSHPCTIDHRYLGVMRLVVDSPVEDVVHECVHAALTAWRLNRGRVLVIDDPRPDHLNPRPHDDDPEELLAYAVGDLAATCLAKLATLTDHPERSVSAPR